jgi:DMSO/TMAO reductase YedYZ molybdopterin-dependent catalytic subunit
MRLSTSASAKHAVVGRSAGDRGGDRLEGVIVGLVTAAVALAAGQLAAAFIAPPASPVLAIGQTAVDGSPEWLKSSAIRTLGADDKVVLVLGIVAVLGVISAFVGPVALRRPWVGFASITVLGGIGGTAAVTRPDSTAAWLIPSVAATAAGAGAFTLLVRRGEAREDPGRAISRPPRGTDNDAARASGFDRRRLLKAALALSAVAAAGEGAAVLTTRRRMAVASRNGVRIPPPTDAASALPPDADLRVAGLSTFFTPNDEFYRVDTALFVPQLRVQDWHLRVHGMVDRELDIGFADLIARPLIERDITLNCVSNQVGGPYVGNARWTGVPLARLLHEAGVHRGATQIVSRSADGMTIGTSTDIALDGRDAMLAVAMNGEPLPFEHGFPVRMLVPGLYGYESATKWIVDMELTALAAADAYWVQRGWAQVAPVKTASRIDTPRDGAQVARGPVTAAGVAWAQHRGISAVEVSVDGGPWTKVRLAAEDSIDTWRQWVWTWPATSGEHVLRVRAVDGDGNVQPGTPARPFPSGATGWDEVSVSVT